MENKDLLKEQKRLEKEKLAAMTAEERKAYKAEKKAEQKAKAQEAYAAWEKEHAEKVAAKKAELEQKGKSLFWFNLGQSAFCQWFVKGWNKFKCNSPELAKLVYQVVFFLVFSNGVTIWQYLVMLFLPNLFGAELAAVEFIWPQVELWSWADGTKMVWGIFNEPVVLKDGVAQIGGGLGNFLAFEVAVFTAQCINFPLQRNITFKSDGNPVIQAIWYFIGWVAISILVNAVWGFIGPVFSHLITSEKAITDLLKTFITGGLSMVVFFFIFKIIFPEKKEEQAN
jgi:hypothetical protein